ncbi:MAG: hypothetical protein SO042_06215 [Bulleidia sp.]|nr:hypothetical protein [Bulleidia sp.]
MEIMDDTYQYFDPGTNENGEGSYEVLGDGVIHFTSGDFEDRIAVSKKKFLYDPSLTIYNSANLQSCGCRLAIFVNEQNNKI